jgi:hypothetical protein
VKEFYAKINALEKESDKIAGGLKVIQIVFVPIVVAVVVALIKGFM